jgi:hypothetical protein
VKKMAKTKKEQIKGHCNFCNKKRVLTYHFFKSTSGFFCRACIKTELKLEKESENITK